nr:MFS transporter [Streptomyces omiyaensis]
MCATQIAGWGVLYYAFPVLNPEITAATGWSGTATMAAFSLALIVSGVAGMQVGRIIDRRGPRAVMTAGSVAGAVGLATIAAAPNLPVFFAGWVLAGFAMASTFYQPAFAALTRWYAPDHVRALTIVTLAGGLASTVFAPLTAVLADHLTWRTTYLVLAGVLAAVTVPAHALALRAPWPPAPPAPADTDATPRAVVRSRPFLLLSLALALSAFAMYAVVVTLVPLLVERGYTTSQAAWALGLGGAGQTLGRTLYATLARRTGATARTVALTALGGLTTAAFAVVPGPYALLVAVSVVAGVVRGNLTLLQATAVTDRWGATHYGRLSGTLNAPAMAASALAPFAAALLAPPLGGTPRLFALLAALALTAAAFGTGTGTGTGAGTGAGTGTGTDTDTAASTDAHPDTETDAAPTPTSAPRTPTRKARDRPRPRLCPATAEGHPATIGPPAQLSSKRSQLWDGLHVIHLADPLRFLVMLAAWVATPWALAPHSVLLAVASVLLLVAALALFATPGDHGMDREKILVPVPGAVTVAVVLLHLAAAVVSSWTAWPTWAAVAVTVLAAASLIAEQPRWRALLAPPDRHRDAPPTPL